MFQTINSVITRKDAYKEGNQEATDNAVAALARMIIFKGGVNDSWIEMTNNLYTLLPLKYDLDECCTTTKLILRACFEGNQLLTHEKLRSSLKQFILKTISLEKEKSSFLDDEAKGLLEKASTF